MTSKVRTAVLAAGLAALVSSQAAYAAPAVSKAGIDPLVSLSVLGTSQSRGAVCSGATFNADANTACGIPLTAAAASAAAVAAQNYPPRAPKPIDPILIGLGLAVFIGIMIWLATAEGTADGQVAPVSPQ